MRRHILARFGRLVFQRLIADLLEINTDYFLYFLVSALVLLVSMIGAIVLCLYHEEGVKRQDLFGQVATEYDKTVINYNAK